MSTRLLLLLLGLAIASRVSAATITFTYSGTDGDNTIQTDAQGTFSFANPALTTVTLADLTSFTLHQIANISNGVAIAIFDFTKADLTAFTISIANGQVTSAAFQTNFKLQTSSPTGHTFKSENFIALSATTGKTQYRDQLFPIPPPPADSTTGSIQFVPEPSVGVFLIMGIIPLFRIRPRPSCR